MNALPSTLFPRIPVATYRNLLRTITVAAVLTTLSVVEPAHADPESTFAPRGQMVVVVNAPTSALDAEATREAIARELNVVVVAPGDPRAAEARSALTVSVVEETQELAVTFAAPDRAVVSRVVTAPAERDATLHAAVRLAGNLARREADEVLGEPAAPAVVAPVAKAPEVLPPAPHATPPVSPTPIEASLFFPLATNASRPNANTHVALNLFYGRVGAVDGVSLGFVNVASESTRGLRVGAFNLTGGPVYGIDFGAANFATGALEGAQLGFGFNVAKGSISGLLFVLDEKRKPATRYALSPKVTTEPITRTTHLGY
jgi:hypothetical protein